VRGVSRNSISSKEPTRTWGNVVPKKTKPDGENAGIIHLEPGQDKGKVALAQEKGKNLVASVEKDRSY